MLDKQDAKYSEVLKNMPRRFELGLLSFGQGYEIESWSYFKAQPPYLPPLLFAIIIIIIIIIIIQIIKVLEFVFCLYFAVMDGWSVSDRDCQVCLNLSLTKLRLFSDGQQI